MRDYYKIFHSDWLASINEAKEEARASGGQFVDLLRGKQESGDAPNDPVVDDVFMSIQVDKMNLIKNCILGKQDSSEVSDALAECGKGKSISIHQTEKETPSKNLTDWINLMGILFVEVVGKFGSKEDANKLLYAPLSTQATFRKSRVYRLEFDGSDDQARAFCS